MRSQAGQATVEWVGLVLLSALVLGGLAGFGAPFGDRGLGTAVADRMACAARGACGGPVGGATADGPGAGRGAPTLPGRAPRPTGWPGNPAASPRAGAPPAASPRAGVPPAASPRAGASPPAHGRSRARIVDAFRRLRGVVPIARRLWIVCIGYRRYVYERDHPRAPHEAMPLDEALEIADTCFNPIGFVEDG